MHCVCKSVCVYTCVLMCVEVRGIFFSHSLSYFLSKGLSLNPGLIEAESARDPPASASSSLAMDNCYSAQLCGSIEV